MGMLLSRHGKNRHEGYEDPAAQAYGDKVRDEVNAAAKADLKQKLDLEAAQNSNLSENAKKMMDNDEEGVPSQDPASPVNATQRDPSGKVEVSHKVEIHKETVSREDSEKNRLLHEPDELVDEANSVNKKHKLGEDPDKERKGDHKKPEVKQESQKDEKK